MRDGELIGSHSLAVTETGDAVTMAIRIDIAVRVLGIRVFVYEHENRETWRNGRLASLESRTNDDGDAHHARVRAEGDRLMIDGSSHQGPAPLDAAPTSYWNFGALDARPWFSSQSGEVLALAFDRQKSTQGTVCRLSGDVETTLIYDSEREWRGCRFSARGADVVYEQTAPGPRFNTLL